MKKTETKKLAALVSASTNQQEALFSWFAKGNTITQDGAREAGIADSKRVVNRLRERGLKVNRELVTSKNSSAIVYSLAEKQNAKIRKQLACA